MKAWEALQILESLPADTEVTLTIGRKSGTPPGPVPRWAQMPQPMWVEKYNPWPKPYNEITCKTVH